VSACLITNCQIISNKSIYALSRAPAILHADYKVNSRQQRTAMQVRWCGYLHLIYELQMDRFLSPEFEITIVCTPLHYQII